MFVIYHSSDTFASVTGVSMLSLFKNNKGMDEIHVLYIEHGLTDDNKTKLMEIADQYGRTLEFMPMPNWSERLNIELKSSKKAWLGFGYNRLFLTEYLPENIDRVLYLDSDTVIEGNLDELWNLDLDGYYLAGVDDCLSSKYRDLIGLSDSDTYCNSGVLLINVKKWRENNIVKSFIEAIVKNNGYFVFNEQSLINSVLGGHIKVLPQKYNVNSLVYLYDYEELMKLRKPHEFSYSRDEFYEARNNPIITHYTGNFYVDRRPWIEKSDHPHKQVYSDYYAMTPWRNESLTIDRRGLIKKFCSALFHFLPRKVMISTVSCLYNYIRPILLQKRKNRIQEGMR